MRLRLSKLLVLGVLASALLATAGSAATTQFASGLVTPETISQTASGGFLVTDAGPTSNTTGQIYNVPAGGGAASSLATMYTLRGGMILPSSFGTVGGQFLAVGFDVTSGNAMASTMNSSNIVTPYHSQTGGAWTQPVLAPSFGSLSGDVLVTNQGAPGDPTNPVPGSVDYFTPTGGVGRLATFSFSAFPSRVQPFGAALANSSFGEAGGPSLLVSDSRSNGIYTVDPAGNIKLFTTIPLDASANQNSLRQIAFAPKEWKKYGGDLFVSLNTGAIDIVNRDGVVVGKISGTFNARGLLFTTMSGQPTLLFSNTAGHNILKAGPGDIVPS
jgi:hypothetical protein